MAWLPDYQQGLAGWGAPPEYRAAPIEGLIRSIWALRQKQQDDLQENLAGAIQQFQRDRVANALTQQYQQEGIIPEELTGYGAMGLGAATDYIKAQQERTYPTMIGGQSYPLTQDQRVRMAIAGAHEAGADRRAQRYNDIFGGGGEPRPLTDAEGRLWIPSASGRPILAPQWMQPNVQKQKEETLTGKTYQKQADALLRKYNLTPEDLLTPREYGTAGVDEKGKPDPSTFEVTQAGEGDQPYVRVTTSGGGTAVIPRNEFDAWHDVFHGRQGVKPPPDQAGASPLPEALPGTFEADLAAAQKAIAEGRNRSAVIARLQEKYPDEDLSGL